MRAHDGLLSGFHSGAGSGLTLSHWALEDTAQTLVVLFGDTQLAGHKEGSTKLGSVRECQLRGCQSAWKVFEGGRRGLYQRIIQCEQHPEQGLFKRVRGSALGLGSTGSGARL